MEMKDTIELTPDADRMVEFLRDTGYSFKTAIADLVDNSIEAGATFIDIRVDTDNAGAVYVAISDNGKGMSREELREAMQYGTPRNAERRLGKFGIGLKTASTSFCRELTVTTRDSSGEMVCAQWDLDLVARENRWLLREPDATLMDEELLEEASPSEAGTVVRWSKVDRLLTEKQNDGSENQIKRALAKKASELQEHLGLVFHRFIEGKTQFQTVEMRVNDATVQAWDPLMTGHPLVEVLLENEFSQSLSDDSIVNFSVTGEAIPARAELDQAGLEQAKIGNDRQGVYVYREDRLVMEPSWLGTRQKEPHNSLARVALNFTKDCDDIFGVDIKKSRIELMPSTLAELDRQVFTPVIASAGKRYRGNSKKARAERSSDIHVRSNTSLGRQGSSLTDAEEVSVDEQQGTVVVNNENGPVTVKYAGNVDIATYVHTVESNEYNCLWEPAFRDNHTVVSLDAGHPFYERVYAPNQNQSVVQAFDYLVYALAAAEISLKDANDRAVFEDMRIAVSRNLKKFANDLPEPPVED